MKTNPVVAIPVHNEAEHIQACLTALSRQADTPTPDIILLLNNTVDDTARVIQQMRPALTFPLHVFEVDFPIGQRSAGYTRRLAMEMAAERAGPGGILLCIDADSRVAPDWLSCNLRHIRAGADAVAGLAEIDPIDAARIPRRLHEDDAREVAYAGILDEIESLIDPDPNDPWPRHSEHSGASIAVTHEQFRRAGGIPAVSVAEDRAFFEALRRKDARIRHALDVRVTVSGRLIGRAAGGMADTIRRRMVRPDQMLDDRLEPARSRVRRVLLRRLVRQAAQHGDPRGTQLVCRVLQIDEPDYSIGFGEVWAAVEATSTLRRTSVSVTSLAFEMADATVIRDQLRLAEAEEGLERAVEHLQQLRWEAETRRIVGDEVGILGAM